jgi:Flp pilus assembly protein TadG
MMTSFGRDSKGNMSVMVPGIVDYMSLPNQKRDLQGTADRAAIAVAQELVVFKARTAAFTLSPRPLLTRVTQGHT